MYTFFLLKTVLNTEFLNTRTQNVHLYSQDETTSRVSATCNRRKLHELNEYLYQV